MLEEMSEELERKAVAGMEAEALALARAAAPVPALEKHALTPAAAAPINVRTPISLGGTSTEAPSPADGFVPVERTPASYLPAELSRRVEAEQVYPSPAEIQGGGGGGGSGNDQTMAELVPAHDSSNTFFDWGDDFAQLGGIRSNLPNDFDDGMMMGLTDDDFSYFDDPAPLPLPSNSTSTAMQLAASASSFGGGGLQSSGPSPKFVDHFSHLANISTPFPSSASPTSPFANHASPQFQLSPNLGGAAFDSPSLSSNALGLGLGLGLGTTPGSELKTPKTPYSPFIERESDGPIIAMGTNPPVPFSAVGTPTTHPLPRCYLPSQFEPVAFRNNLHALLDDKYDPRKGKFGLPSPESDSAEEDLSSSLHHEEALEWVRRRKSLSRNKTWYTAICDPRITAAVALKRKRTPSLAMIRSPDTPRKGLSSIGRVRKTQLRKWTRTEGESDSHGGEDESEDDEMDFEDDEHHQLSTEEPDPLHVSRIEHPFAGALLLLRDHLDTVLSAPSLPTPSAPVVPPKAMVAADAALEVAASLIVDQVAYNPEFRSPLCESLPTLSPKLGKFGDGPDLAFRILFD